jgi:HlyD family secretion protein
VRQRDNVLRVPAAALRFRPPEGTVPSPEPSARAGGGGAGTAQAADQPAPRGEGERRRGPSDGSGGGGGRRRRGPGGAADGAGDGGAAADRGRPAVLYVPDDKGRPQPQRVRVGLSDGQFVEVVSGLQEGARVITGLEGETRAGGGRPGATPSNNPFAPGRGQRRQR